MLLMHRRSFRFAIVFATALLGACDTSPSTAVIRSCQVIAQGAPSSAIIPIGTAITVAVAAEAACPQPLVRNETPTIIRMDSVDVNTFRVTGTAIGDGRIRIRSRIDTTVTQVLTMTVVPLGNATALARVGVTYVRQR